MKKKQPQPKKKTLVLGWEGSNIMFSENNNNNNNYDNDGSSSSNDDGYDFDNDAFISPPKEDPISKDYVTRQIKKLNLLIENKEAKRDGKKKQGIFKKDKVTQDNEIIAANDLKTELKVLSNNRQLHYKNLHLNLSTSVNNSVKKYSGAFEKHGISSTFGLAIAIRKSSKLAVFCEEMLQGAKNLEQQADKQNDNTKSGYTKW